MDAEDEATRAIAAIFGDAPVGEVWIGDDAAVLCEEPGKVLLATDALVEGVHFDRRLCSLVDVGFKAMSVNVSDMAAMGAVPLAAVVAVTGASLDDLALLYEGLGQAATRYRVPVVGGDLSDGNELVLAPCIFGRSVGDPVLRSGARGGDLVYVTGPLGASAAGLRALGHDPLAKGPHVDAYRRPLARLVEGRVVKELGASAMIDISDGFSIDLARLLDASQVGVEITELPIAERASEQDALFGGEDYELLFTAPASCDVVGAFCERALPPPYLIGTVLKDRSRTTVLGEALSRRGYTHRLDAAR